MMTKTSWMKFLATGLCFIVLLSACSPAQPTESANALRDAAVKTAVAAQMSTVMAQPTVTPQPSLTPTPTVTPTPTITPTPEPTFTPTWVFSPAGNAVVPILLYHHIAVSENSNRYYVTPDQFEAQMAWLYEHGYTTITASRLADVLHSGAELPAKPVVITFDDGDLEVFENAYPIMSKYGYSGVFYIISGWIDAKGMVNKEQLLQMVADGWEIGSHSFSHIDLTQNYDALGEQVVGSKRALEAEFGVPVNTFAYPFGMIDAAVADVVVRAGYRAGMGLGTSFQHDLGDLWYLNRLEVRSEYDLGRFIDLLPWKE